MMTSISGTMNTAALLILQQTDTVENQKTRPADDLIAVANGKTPRIGVESQPTQAQSKISESLFSVNHDSVNKLKLDLIDRTAKALGVDKDDYSTREDFANAMQRALGRLTIEGGDAALFALEKELGLDKLGISVSDVIASARDPEANDKVTKALEQQIGKVGDTERPFAIGLHQFGLYAPSSL